MAEKISIFAKLIRVKEYVGTVLLITTFGFIMSSDPVFSDMLIILLANLTCTAFIFGFNDMEDAEDDAMDERKRKRNTISNNQISRNKAKVILATLLLVSLTLYSFLGPKTFVLGALGIVLGWLYSLMSIRLKSKPVLDLLSHGYFFGLLYFITPIVFFGTDNYIFSIWYGFCVYLLSIVVDLNNEIRDMELDKKAKLRNTVIFFRLNRLQEYIAYIWIVVVGFFVLPIFLIKPTVGIFFVILFIAGAGLLSRYKSKLTKYRYTLPHQQLILGALSLIVLYFV